MSCNIYQTVRYVGFSKKEIEGIIKTILDFLKKKNVEISVHLIGDKKIKKINNDYRAKNKVTDVLVFAMQDLEKNEFGRMSRLPACRQAGAKDFGGQSDLGDIFISIPQVKRQAREQKILYKEELVRILAHGVLHLNGFDHMEEKDKKEMFGLQEKLVKIVNRIFNL